MIDMTFQEKVLFMALIQDEDSKDGGKSPIKRTCESTSKPSRKWTYNGIYMSLQHLKRKKGQAT